MLEITTAIFLTLMGSAIYHLIPQGYLRTRMTWVAVLSFFIVFAYYPVAAVFAAGAGTFAWLLALSGRRNKVIQKYGPFSLIILLALFAYEDIRIPTIMYSRTLVQFGMSFYILRLYLALRTAAVRREKVGLEEFLTIALFFPIFPAGPICAQEAFKHSAVVNRPLLHNYLLGLLRIGMGIFALYFATTIIDQVAAPLTLMTNKLTNWQGMGWFATYQVMLLKFLYLYANFAGYTEIAIGLGLFFGFEIPENFRYPFLATNIQNFWQRWHLSLSRFITRQIYMPLMLTMRKPRLCLFLAFVMIGMWHKMTLQYLVWGLGHGVMFVAHMTWTRSGFRTVFVARINPWVWMAVSWLTTMTIVAFLFVFANEPTLAQSMVFTRSLVLGE